MSVCSCHSSKVTKTADSPAETMLPSYEETLPEDIPETAAVENTGQKPEPFSRFWYDNYYGVSDLSDLLDYINDASIKTLMLRDCTFTDLSPLSRLPELETLSILDNPHISDLSPLSSLENLKILLLDELPHIESIAPLSTLVNLRYLRLEYSDVYFRELVPLQNLEKLYLGSYGEIVDFTYISQLQSLKRFSISPIYPFSITHFNASTYSNTFKEMQNVEKLGDLINLESLGVSTPMIEDTMPEFFPRNFDISWIIALQKLREFSLNHSSIDDISPLAELPNLAEVDLYQTRVKDITPLLKSKSIKKIWRPITANSETDDPDYPSTIITNLYRQFEERGIDFSIFFRNDNR
jgi:Leucine-rich repeat (LRR) protein